MALYETDVKVVLSHVWIGRTGGEARPLIDIMEVSRDLGTKFITTP